MKENNDIVLYVGTITMVFLALIFIIMVLWASFAIRDFKKFSRDRDKHYSERIDYMESMIKKEFMQILRSIKHIKT